MNSEKQAEYFLNSEEMKHESLKDGADLTSGPETDFDSTQFKLEVNDLVWRNASGKTTLEEAETIASAFWAAIRETY